MAHVSTRLPADLVARLDRQAERRMVSRNYLITQACERLLGETEDVSDLLENEAQR